MRTLVYVIFTLYENYNKCNYKLGMWATIRYLSRKVLSQKNNVGKLTGRGKWIIDSVDSGMKKTGSKAFFLSKAKTSPKQLYFCQLSCRHEKIVKVLCQCKILFNCGRVQATNFLLARNSKDEASINLNCMALDDPERRIFKEYVYHIIKDGTTSGLVWRWCLYESF